MAPSCPTGAAEARHLPIVLGIALIVLGLVLLVVAPEGSVEDTLHLVGCMVALSPSRAPAGSRPAR